MESHYNYKSIRIAEILASRTEYNNMAVNLLKHIEGLDYEYKKIMEILANLDKELQKLKSK